MINPIKTKNGVSFQSLIPIKKSANKLSGGVLKNSEKDIIQLSQDVDLEIIAKRGFLSKIKSLIFYVKNDVASDWFSLSIDPKGYMPKNNPRYSTTERFTKENVINSINKAKKNLNKYKMQIERPSLPADAVLIAKLLKH